ncbi:MAG: hypothetical protein AAFY25_12695 [Pseudomonadota bacterium]
MILTPLGMRPLVRLPYSMQLCSGTYDLLPSITYMGRSGNLGFGAQLTGVFRLGDNKGCTFGNEAKANVWGSVQPAPWVSFADSLEDMTLDNIHGTDPLIRDPVQTTDPKRYGGDFVTVYLGVNMIGQNRALRA